MITMIFGQESERERRRKGGTISQSLCNAGSAEEQKQTAVASAAAAKTLGRACHLLVHTDIHSFGCTPPLDHLMGEQNIPMISKCS